MKTVKTISIVGASRSGKSILASQVDSILKTQGLNSIFIEEYATEYIAEYGVPMTMEHQQLIFQEQYRKERLFADIKDFIICDSASFLSYVYSKKYYSFPLTKQMIATLNHMHKKVLDSLEYWDFIFYVPLIESNASEETIFQNKEELQKIDKMIKGLLESENIPYYDLTDVPLEKRADFILKKIIEEKKVEDFDVN